MPEPWANWSGSVTCAPHSVVRPHSETEISSLVRQANQTNAHIRVAGTGHSFVPLCASDEILLSLDHLQGVVATNRDLRQATVWAGTKIHQLGDPLWASGLALANMGDIDRQALAGAISTGTHGTGASLGSISTQVIGLRIVAASGESIDCSPTVEPEIFKAAQVSLGALGIITQVTLQLLPAYQLHERTWIASFDECLADLETNINANRHFEFFWVPSENVCAMKALNLAQAGATPTLQRLERNAQGELTKAGFCLTGRLPRYIDDDRLDRSYRIFPSERNLKFNETEFAVPAPNGPDCLREIRQLMQTKYPAIIWPLEYRTLAADDIWLSPAYQRATVTISVHQAAELPYQPFFADVEAIFRNHQGRPHWGKIHAHTARELSQLYPLWDKFQTIRTWLDPQGMFTNDYLRTIL
ncbi:MAG: FAD-binding protein [Chloroflexi bacterium]|nr:FAD-binding protein [Chloroflexota bacterium]